MKFALRRIGIDTGRESVAYLHDTAMVCACLGLHPMERLEVVAEGRTVLAVLNGVETQALDDGVLDGAVGLGKYAFGRLGLPDGATVEVRPAEPPVSVDFVRAKMVGRSLVFDEFAAITRDLVAGRYSNIELTAFVAGCAIHGLDDSEVQALVTAMVEGGERLSWAGPIVADKHSIGGVPGNRTTPIVTAIAAAAGLVMPKTSSRSVTSPAGTADTLETLMNVELPPEQIGAVVGTAGACMVWGGALNLAPADDLIIRVEHPLHLDAEGLMIASILAKKVAVGSTHVVLDIPVGDGAKVVDGVRGEQLRTRFERIGTALGLRVRAVITDGSQPIGRGIGPALEARDVLQVLARDAQAPADLREKSLMLAGELLELSGAASPGAGLVRAQSLLDSGEALAKFERIRTLQGRREPPPTGAQTFELRAQVSGRVTRIASAAVTRTARLAGAPKDAGAGVDCRVRVGDEVHAGDLLLRVHAQSEPLLEFASAYLASHPETVEVGGA